MQCGMGHSAFQFYISAIITCMLRHVLAKHLFVSILHKCDYNCWQRCRSAAAAQFQFYISAIITLYKTSLGLIVYQDDNDCKDNTFL